MFDIAVVTFLAPNPDKWSNPNKNYEYRIPDYLKGTVQAGMLGIVAWKGNGNVNPTVVKIDQVKSVLDGDFVGEYAFLIGAVDLSKYSQEIETEKKRARLLQLIAQEKKRVLDGMDLATVARISPTARELVGELERLSGTRLVANPPATMPGWVDPSRRPLDPLRNDSDGA